MGNSLRRLSAWLAATVALWPAGAEAQTTVRSFEELMGIVKAEDTVVVTDMSRRRVKGALTAIDADSLSLSTEGLTQTFARSEVSTFDLRSSAPPLKIEAAISELESVAFSGDGALLAVGGRDMRVKIFDAATGNLLRLLEQVEPDQFVFRVHHLTFSPSARLIATIADDPTLTDVGRPGTVRVFEVGTGREIARIPFPELAHDLRFAQDESFFEVAVGRRRIRWERYPLSAAALINDACGYVQRNLDALEWARFMGDEPRRETCPGAGKYPTPPR